MSIITRKTKVKIVGYEDVDKKLTKLKTVNDYMKKMKNRSTDCNVVVVDWWDSWYITELWEAKTIIYAIISYISWLLEINELDWKIYKSQLVITVEC